MSRLPERERRAIRAIESALQRWTPGGASVIETVLDPIGELIAAEKPIAYAVGPCGDGVACSFVEGAVPKGARRALNLFFARQPVGWGIYNPLCPEPEHRNVPVRISKEEMAAQALIDVCRRFDLHDREQLRVLVCDGPSILAWVGGFRPDRFTAHEARLLGSLVPALHETLRMERRLDSAGLGAMALEACLEHIAGAAFVVSRRGFIEHANRAGWAELDQRGIDVVRAVNEAIEGKRPGWSVAPLGGPIERPDHLVIAPAPRHDAAALAARAASRWSLTPRQGDVLALVAEGFTNVRIALELGCSPRTVEIHISKILRRADCDSRAALVAKVWREAAF